MTNYIEGLQNQFSAYAKTAIKNTKIHYLQKRQKIKEKEMILEYLEEVGENSVDDILFQIGASADKSFEGILEMKLLLDQISDYKLFQVLTALPVHHKNIILLRIFYEKSFTEIGNILGISSKKAENTYFNIIKKIRKSLGDRQYEF